VAKAPRFVTAANPQTPAHLAESFGALLSPPFMSHRSAVLLLVAASLLWSFGGVLIKSVDLPSLAKACVRSGIAALVMWGWLRRPQFTWSRTQLAAALAYAGTVVFFITATDRTTAANAIFLQYTAPIYVALLSHWLLGERTRPLDWLCIVIALGGIALFFRDQLSATGFAGNLAALASGFCFGATALLVRKEKDASPASALLLGNLFAALIALPFSFGKMPSAPEWGLLVVLGALQLGLPYILYSLAIRRVTALEAVLIPMLEPILNPVWVALRKGEVPGPWSLAGGALVLGAVILRGVVR
jgi:drug/metabolite transporter (DMT)-like permease